MGADVGGLDGLGDHEVLVQPVDLQYGIVPLPSLNYGGDVFVNVRARSGVVCPGKEVVIVEAHLLALIE